MAFTAWRLFDAEVPGVAFLNIIFAVFQLAMVAYSVGQSAAVLVVNAALEHAAERDGFSNGILFTGPFFAKDGSFANGFSCAGYLIVGSLIHLAIGLFLLAGRSTRKKAATLCLVWYSFTLLFLIAHMTLATLKALTTPDDLLPSKWNDSEVMTEVAFALLVILEGLQIWIVFEFVREMDKAETEYWTDAEVPRGQLTGPPTFPRDSVSRDLGQESPPRYSQVTETQSELFKNVSLK